MSLRMTRVDPDKNMARFYEIDIQPSLFGDFAVMRHWGRIGTSGQSKSFWFQTEGVAKEAAGRLETQKRYRGYNQPIAQFC